MRLLGSWRAMNSNREVLTSLSLRRTRRNMLSMLNRLAVLVSYCVSCIKYVAVTLASLLLSFSSPPSSFLLFFLRHSFLLFLLFFPFLFCPLSFFPLLLSPILSSSSPLPPPPPPSPPHSPLPPLPLFLSFPLLLLLPPLLLSPILLLLHHHRMMTQWRFKRGVEEQTKAFLDGFNEVVPLHWLQFYDEKELELMLCGMQDLNVNEWEKHTVYRNYTRHSKQIQWFWQVGN